MHSKINEAIVTEFLKEPLVVPAPDYAGDIALAWPLLSEMYRRGWFYRLDSKGDRVLITLQNLKRKTFVIEAESGAAAICEGALKVADEENTGKLIELHIKNSPPDGNAS